MSHQTGSRANTIGAYIQRRYVAALIVLVALVSVEFIASRFVIEKQEATAAMVNISGKQRMLSQRIALRATEFTITTDIVERLDARTALRETLNEFEAGHGVLVRGSPTKGDTQISDPRIEAFFQGDNGFDMTVRQFIADVRTLLSISRTSVERQKAMAQRISQHAEGPMLLLLDEMVTLYQLNGEQGIRQIGYTQLIVWFFVIAVLLLEVVLIFHPMVQHVTRTVEEMEGVQKQLAHAKNAAEAGSKAKDEFIANISHELRTPLNAIMGFSATMDMEMFGPLENDKYRQYVKDIHWSAEHLGSIINDILDLAKVESGTLAPILSECDVVDEVKSSIALITSKAINRKISIQNELQDFFPTIRMDKKHLKQIIINILSNAVKFSDEGGQVVVGGSWDKNRNITIFIQDNGIGIEEDHLPAICEPFVQVADSMTRNHEGTGLGLAVTQRLLRHYGGELKLESTLGEGTRVSFFLPESGQPGNAIPPEFLSQVASSGIQSPSVPSGETSEEKTVLPA